MSLTATFQFFTHQRGTYLGLYTLCVAGSNYLAPVLCGFIAQYQGWQWVFYWPGIFIGAVFVFLFFFMEETTWDRTHITGLDADTTALASEERMKHESPNVAAERSQGITAVSEAEPTPQKKTTYIQKLALWHTPQSGTRPNLMIRRIIHTFQLMGWPIIFYAG
jgi:MFS family permease